MGVAGRSRSFSALPTCSATDSKAIGQFAAHIEIAEEALARSFLGYGADYAPSPQKWSDLNYSLLCLPQIESDSPMGRYWAMFAGDDRHFQTDLGRDHRVLPAAG